MAHVHRLKVRVNVRNGESTFTNTGVEVLFVAFVLFVLVERHDFRVGVNVFIPILLNRFARDLATIHEDLSLGSFDQDPIVATTGDMDFETVCQTMNDVDVSSLL